jgi:hypothetical protein
MDIQDLRRYILKALIDEKYGGNVSAFATAIKKAQSQIADTLDRRKAFGEKVAREIETRAKLPRGYFDREEASDPDLAALLRHWQVLLPEARLRVLHFAKLEHASQFTGDPGSRAEHERHMTEFTNNHKGNHHDAVSTPDAKKRGR